ncbi:MAG: hypothetical protein A2173_10225 [Planctomycetes bacterium RBG_13_44_8b]|nr:MAG: hypothetical protein A2173_10225 [Planctomycetes bacterium RBG_13_44_8b]
MVLVMNVFFRHIGFEDSRRRGKTGPVRPIRQIQGRQAHSGLTLVELLVAITIMAILAAGLYTVSSRVEKQAKEKLTKSTIDNLCTALEQYHDFYGKFPDITVAGDYPPDCNGIERLYHSLGLAPDAKKILGKLHPSMIVDNEKNESPAAIYPEIVDAWGQPFRYTYSSGNNFPVITSAGPNKKSGDDDDISSK